MKSFRVFPVALAIIASLTVPSSGNPASRRSSRSIWPFVGSSSSTSEESGVTPEADVYDAAIAQGILKVGPNDRRIWKIHKYRGIDIRPIEMVPEEEIAVSFAQPANSDAGHPPQSATSGSNVVDHQSTGNAFQSSVENSPAGHSVFQSGNFETTTEELDLSFLDDLGGMAWFLPEPKDEEGSPEEAKIQVESEASSAAAEDDQPGFLSSLLSKLTFGMLGSSSRPVKGKLNGLQAIEPADGLVESDGSEPLYQEATYHLPETKGNYVAYRLPISEQQAGVGDSTGSDGSQLNSYSDDKQSTSFAWNGETANLPAVPREPEVHGDQPVGYEALNPRGYQNGAPIKAFVEGAATVGNSAALQTTGNGVQEDDANVLKASDYASLSLSSVLPYREHVDFGSHGSTSERRVSDDLALKDNVEEVAEVEEEIEVAEQKSPKVFVVEPALEVATTYSKIRNHKPTESST